MSMHLKIKTQVVSDGYISIPCPCVASPTDLLWINFDCHLDISSSRNFMILSILQMKPLYFYPEALKGSLF